MSAAEDSSDQNLNRASWFTRAMLWAGVACCLQFLVVGVLGVVRG